MRRTAKLAVAGQHGQQGVDGAFVHAKRKVAAAAGAKIVDGTADFIAQVEDAFGIADKQPAGVGKLAGTGSTGEERFADFIFELADGDADGGLSAIELLGGAREAAFAGYGEEDVEFGEIHRRPQDNRQKPGPRQKMSGASGLQTKSRSLGQRRPSG